MSPDSRYFIEALHRGFSVLEVFTEGTPWLSLMEIAAKTGLEKSTAFRFVYTLEQLGYLERHPETKKFRPGLKVLSLGFNMLRSLGIVDLVRPYLHDLFERAGETTNLSVRDETEIVYLARISAKQIVSINLSVGSRLPVYCTSMGKAQLIDLSQQELADLLGTGPYEKLTKNTITTLDDLVIDLERIRQRGYALNDEELAAGLRSVAAPVRGEESQIVAAVNVSVPGAQVTSRELKNRLAPLVVETGLQISSALGARVR